MCGHQIVSTTRSSDLYAWSGHGSGTTSSSADGLNRLSSHGGVTPTYDARGNLTSDGTRSYGYDSGMNLYAYVKGDPVNFTDPLGLDWDWGEGTVNGGRSGFIGTAPLPRISTFAGPDPRDFFRAMQSRPSQQRPNRQRSPTCPPVPGPENVLRRAIAEAEAARYEAEKAKAAARISAGSFAGLFVLRIEGSLGGWFAAQERTGGRWDFKNQPGTRGNQDFGNFAYGALSSAIGYKSISGVAADIYSYLDTGPAENEDARIEEGRRYYARGCHRQ